MRSVCTILFLLASSLTVTQTLLGQEEELARFKKLYEQAASLYQQGKYQEAIPLAREALTIQEKVLGSDHAFVAASLNNLADLYNALGDYAAAEPYYKRALKVLEQAFGPNHPDVASSLDNLAALYRVQSNYTAAEPLYQRALKIWEQILGPSHLNVAISLNDLADLYRAQGNYTAAEPLSQRALKILEQVYGPKNPYVAAGLNNLASLYQTQGNYTAAEPLFQRSLKILEQALGPNHPDVATSLNNLAGLYKNQGNYAAAEPLYQRSLKIFEQVLGVNNPDVAVSLNNLADLYDAQDNYTAAEPLYQRSLRILEQALGLNHPNVAKGLGNLARLYRAQGNYTAAEPLFQRALKIGEQALGPNHPDVATSLADLAGLYNIEGNYAAAESLFQRALKIEEQALGPNHPDVATSLNNLAGLYKDQGNYTAAEPLYQRSLKIFEQALGANHPDVASNLNNLAILYIDLGNYAAAEPLYQRSLKIFEQALGPNHSNVAASLNNLAGLYESQGNYAAAEPLFQRSLKILEQALGPNHPDVATSLNNLAGLYKDQGNYTATEPLYQRALKVSEQALGSDHPKVALLLNNLALLYQAQGNYTAAEPLFQRSLKILEQALGANHPDVATSLNNLAAVEMALNRPQRAMQHFQTAAGIETAFMQNVFTHSTEAEKFAFLRTLSWRLDELISLTTQAQLTDFAPRIKVFDVILQRKAASLEASSQQQQVYFTSDDSVSIRLYKRFRSLSQQIARLTFAGLGDTAITAYRQRLNQLSAEREKVEDSLAQRSGAFLRERQEQQADAQQVAAALPKGSTFIEFVRYRQINFKAKDKKQWWGAARYAVFSLTAKNAELLHMLDLGLAQPIDSLILACRTEMKENISKLGPRPRQEAEEYLSSISQQLYQLLFAPLKAALPDSGVLYCAPDGPLHLLPFEILVDENGKYLAERYQFNYLGSGRDLLRFEKISSRVQMYIFADADFDGKSATQVAAQEPLLVSGDLFLPSENVRRSKDWRGIKFDPLDSTAIEARVIQKLFRVNESEVFLAHRATEQNLLSLQSPWRLHIATHGYFIKDQVDVKQFAQPELFRQPFDGKRLALGQFENPLLRSFLALAGANIIGQQQNPNQTYDGIATAYEISGMNLQGTDLVVLSACETGLGDVQNGEGVFGLRRAFQLAGAQTVVMSLWKVPDNDTKNLMVAFYNRLKKGEGKSQALRHASLAMMKKQREQNGSAHPYFWGAFICAGNPE